VPKENGKLRICVDYRKLNAETKKDPFPLPFSNSILNSVNGHEMYSFMDGYSNYNQVKMAEENKEKTTFILEWGLYAHNVMPFGLCNVPTTFQKVVTKTFKEYLNKFIQVFLDNFNVYGSKKDHLGQLQKCLEECRQNGISLNPKKCTFCVLIWVFYLDTLFVVDLRKIIVIITMPVPVSVTKIK
jgi:hypothetical protein